MSDAAFDPQETDADGAPLVKRIGDRERQAAAAQLQHHYADGRLTMTEFRERMDSVLKASTQRQVDAMLVDLPSLDADGQPIEQARRGLLADHGRRNAVIAWLIMSAFFTAIWLATGADGTFWPIWPILGIGLGTAFRVFTIDQDPPGPS